ncbi:hypothetical protein CEXT_309921 [Caerostris extrusa]|uniref:Uncharacterized protein n=1 Tax=Caerostris extrusa TaxID=172846 RepID=A0AAV4QGK7_CAEEX|nr:hypothetical protein CEXT_309921 [Caerostris extrusa]
MSENAACYHFGIVERAQQKTNVLIIPKKLKPDLIFCAEINGAANLPVAYRPLRQWMKRTSRWSSHLDILAKFLGLAALQIASTHGEPTVEIYVKTGLGEFTWCTDHS